MFVYRNIELTNAQFNRCAAHSLGNTQAQIRFATKLRFYAGLAHRIAEGSGTIADPKIKLRLGELAARCKIPETFVTAAEAPVVRRRVRGRQPRPRHAVRGDVAAAAADERGAVRDPRRWRAGR